MTRRFISVWDWQLQVSFCVFWKFLRTSYLLIGTSTWERIGNIDHKKCTYYYRTFFLKAPCIEKKFPVCLFEEVHANKTSLCCCCLMCRTTPATNGKKVLRGRAEYILSHSSAIQRTPKQYKLLLDTAAVPTILGSGECGPNDITRAVGFSQPPSSVRKEQVFLLFIFLSGRCRCRSPGCSQRFFVFLFEVLHYSKLLWMKLGRPRRKSTWKYVLPLLRNNLSHIRYILQLKCSHF
jgi:hypothetical protein